ncbi:ModD protein [Sulfurimonas sp. HSL-1716]|uniref:ModD protein n=1 Tax=Hydrocurvibacter sulfurireducens TaxID=3131937 RepID=UPI0031F78C83
MSLLLDAELLEYIREDMPYFDLTTTMLGEDFDDAILEIRTREETVVACSEEAARIAELLGCEVEFFVPSSNRVKAQEAILRIKAKGEILHRAWKLTQVLLEYACGMATYANDMLLNVQKVNRHCEILVTRKSIPFAKKFAVRALLCGGVLPHRLGLSESILIFSHHRSLFKDTDAFKDAFKRLKPKAVEKKIVVECEDIQDAKEMLMLGADVIQMDKCALDIFSDLVGYRQTHFPDAKITAAGGINKDNAAEFAKTGVDAIITSSPYQAKMADLSAKWIKI